MTLWAVRCRNVSDGIGMEADPAPRTVQAAFAQSLSGSASVPRRDGEKVERMESKSKRLAILVGGGPAPGINGVIGAATIEALNNGLEVVGFFEGFKYLMEGDSTQHRILDIEDVSRIHFQGGSILRTSRANPTKKPEHMQKVLKCLEECNIGYVITIGGDDTAFSSSQLAAASQGSLKVAHVPKTIDNDLPLPPSIPTFGFQTARHTGVAIVKNLMADAKTAPRWYIVVAMGRKAGHLALGIGKAAAAPLTLIPEEFGGRTVTFGEVCDIVEGVIYKRQAYGRDHGVIILAEGLVEHMTPEERDEVFGGDDYERDEHGHIKLDDVEFGKAVRDELRRRFKARGKKITVTNKNLGYELRCADPIPYDSEYTRDLGFGAVRFLMAGGSGAIITFHGGVMKPMSFEELRDPATGRPSVRMVDVTGESFQVALRYMIRLEARDKEPARLEKLAAAAGMTPEEFLAKFGYVMK